MYSCNNQKTHILHDNISGYNSYTNDYNSYILTWINNMNNMKTNNMNKYDNEE